MRIQIWLAAPLIALALSGCGRSDSEQNSADNTTEIVENSDGAEIGLDTPAGPAVETTLSEENMNKIVAYGICSSINKAIVGLANPQNDGSLDGLIMTNAHEASIYMLAILDEIMKFPKGARDSALSVSDQKIRSFIRDNLLASEVSGEDLIALRDDNCDFSTDMGPVAGNLRQNYPSDYSKYYEVNKRMGL